MAKNGVPVQMRGWVSTETYVEWVRGVVYYTLRVEGQHNDKYHSFHELTIKTQPPGVTVSFIPSPISCRRSLQLFRSLVAPSLS